MDCLANITGVTNNTEIPYYDDLDEELQDAIIVSTSGLYVDDLPGGIDLMGVDDPEYMAALLKLALKAGAQSQKVLSDELLLAINTRYQAAKPRFYGDIGRRAVSANISTSIEHQGQRYRMHEPVAGNMKISRISINVNGSGALNIYVARADKYEKFYEVLYTFPVTSVAGTWTNCDMSSQDGGVIKLPMEVNGIAQDYYIFWKRSETAGFLPKNNEIKCGTCSGTTSLAALDSFCEYKGIAFTDENKLNSVNIDSHGHGLSVSAEVGCENSMVICREYEKKEAVRLMMQWAALYKMGELWIEYIQKSAFVNKTNLQNREYMWGKRNHFRKEFDERITAIANGMTLGETNCYTCNDDTAYKATIYS